MNQENKQIINDKCTKYILSENSLRYKDQNAHIFRFIRHYGNLGRSFYNQVIDYCQKSEEIYGPFGIYSDYDLSKMFRKDSAKTDVWNQMLMDTMADTSLTLYYGSIKGYQESLKSFYKNAAGRGRPRLPFFKSYKEYPFYHFAMRRVKLIKISTEQDLLNYRKKLKKFPFLRDLFLTDLSIKDGPKYFLQCINSRKKEWNGITPQNNLNEYKLMTLIPLPAHLYHDEIYSSNKTDHDKGLLAQVRFRRLSEHKIQIEISNKQYQKQNIATGDYVLALDRGLRNVLTGISNNSLSYPFIIKGRNFTWINQKYNNLIGSEQQKLSQKNQHTSDKYYILQERRKRIFDHYTHVISRQIIDYCLQYQISEIIIGKNKGWKQKNKEKKKLTKSTRKRFNLIPFDQITQKIEYKAQQYNIGITYIEESYTSLTDHLAKAKMYSFGEKLTSSEKKQIIEMKKQRKTSGLYHSSTGIILNSDINGAIGIMRKFKGDSIIDQIKQSNHYLYPYTLNNHNGQDGI